MGNTPGNPEVQCFGKECDLREKWARFAPTSEGACTNFAEQIQAKLEIYIPNLYEADQALVRDIIFRDLYLPPDEQVPTVSREALHQILDKIVACVHRFPPLCDWLQVMVEEKDILKNMDWLETLISDGSSEHSEPITLATWLRLLLHSMWVYEVYGRKLGEGKDHWKYQEKIRDHYMMLVKAEGGARFKRWQEPSFIKAFSVDQAYSIISKIKTGTETYTKQELVDIARFTLSLNILEAVYYDMYLSPASTRNRNRKRGASGFALVSAPVGGFDINPETDTLHTEMSAEYMILYFCWNLSLVLQFGRGPRLVGKLLQPWVFCASPARFIYNRMHSLYLAAMSATIKNLKGQGDIAPLPNQEFWLDPLIDILFQYSQEYYQRTHNGQKLKLHIIRRNIRNLPEFAKNVRSFMIV